MYIWGIHKCIPHIGICYFIGKHACFPDVTALLLFWMVSLNDAFGDTQRSCP